MKWLVLCFFVFLIPFSYFAGWFDHKSKTFINLGTASITGVYYLEGNAVCRIMSKKQLNDLDEAFVCSVLSSPGAPYNIGSLISGDMDVAIVQSDVFDNAYKGLSQFDKPNTNLRFLMNLHRESFTLVTRSDTKVKSLDDLPGAIVNRNVPGSGVYNTFGLLMKVKGWNDSDFKLVSQLKSSEQAQALCDGKIDVMMDIIGHPNGALMEAASMCDIRVVSVDDKTIDDLIAKHPIYKKTIIPANLLNAKDDVQTFGVDAWLVTTDRFSEDMAYSLVKKLFESVSILQSTHLVLNNIDFNSMSNSGSSHIHDGAYRYFKELDLVD